jgi:hypothetical protein
MRKKYRSSVSLLIVVRKEMNDEAHRWVRNGMNPADFTIRSPTRVKPQRHAIQAGVWLVRGACITPLRSPGEFQPCPEM